MRGRFSSFSYIALFLLSWLLTACQDLGTPVKEKPPCPSIRIAAPSPFSDPVWHPSGQFIGFNYLPLTRNTYPYGDHCQGEYEWNGDSLGYWIINADGTNLRRISSRMIGGVSWSPDGQWIAFHSGAQIYKMRFTGVGFDTTTIVQLTAGGNNFYPAWSPDGNLIAYNKSICEGPNTCGIWLMNSDGTQHQFVAQCGNYPAWHPSGQKIIYLTREVTGTGQTIGDRLWSFEVATNSASNIAFLGGQNNDNRHPRYSPEATMIMFGSKPTDGRFNIWMMNGDASGAHQVTTEGTGDGWSSWSPDGSEIVYLSHRHDDWSYANGTFWIVNVETAQKRQLTFNLC